MADDTVQIIVPPDASPALIERLSEAFPDAELAAPEPTLAEEGVATAAADALLTAASSSVGLLDALRAWGAANDFGVVTIALIAAALLGGYGVERLARAAFDRSRAAPPAPRDFRDRLRAAALWGVGRVAGLVLFAWVATALGRAALPTNPEILALGDAALSAAIFLRGMLILFGLLLAPGAPHRRLMGFDDATAAQVWRRVLIAALAVTAARCLREYLVVAGDGASSVDMARLALIAVNTGVAAWFFVAVARPVAALMLRDGVEGWRAVAARYWWVLYVALAVLDGLVRAAGALGLFGDSATGGAGPTLMIMIMAPLTMVGIGLWREEAQGETRSISTAAGFAALEAAVAVSAGLALISSWGIDPFHPGESGLAAVAPRIAEAAIIAIVAVCLWRGASAVMGRAPQKEDGALVDEENNTGGSRLDTIMPVLRASVLSVIAIVGGMSVLTALGLDIAPLLASAGVLGLAIGFGAQKLVTDVISGMFYLLEDAFRSGEYIVTESGKGVVEKISLRSVRLRHHRGPVFTIPFSDIGTVQNHSRDWVKMKFTFQVPAGTDLEMVRKLVKKVGEELLTVPELEGKFLEPMKSQGALAITGPSYTIGCKFTCKPGQQFTIRRFAYARLQNALMDKGVKLYAPQVMLAAQDGQGQPTAPT